MMMTKPMEIWQPTILIAIGALTIFAVNRGRKRDERSRIETAEEMQSRRAAEKAAQDMLSHARGVKGAQGKIVLRGPAVVTRGRTPLRLHYFPTRNRAEVARLLLEIGHEPYEAVCYFYQTFLNSRSQFPFGDLPVLELADGTMIVQQHTIVRYVADITKMNGGRNRVKQAKVDMVGK
ncbi:glutathione s-transferase, putative [Perkinsus marinus ATCC 50983]|uniref:Glutathione s-transferase, putative n=1 Tax=Perkinsus marinus (strain ATCC 50983 / TXsc) TaxID=423536 RepID=C5KIA1_PERM5|nr:glutathione s-transferase, putative [Perkinsus marinus ATCC 50983]EER15764.1 glutathione s-transferase, putative [Perkinsus marinus ATCC 50983]|eukprot:XP_002783968.1 glutathione s-transferase, putative [Perkinsus marinus ATCC 50983]